jgi:DNA-binding beta-propeller fold protein YncE
MTMRIIRFECYGFLLCVGGLAMACAACNRGEAHYSESQVREIGRQGVADGRFNYPREILIAPNRNLVVIDKTGRIQHFSPDGECVAVWNVPNPANGTPTGAAFDRAGRLLVADTHYSRILRYAADGTSWTQFGRYGQGPGELVYPTDIAVDKAGHIYVTNYGQRDRVLKFASDGAFLAEWGATGAAPGEFNRPMSLALLGDAALVVADSCNHRIQKFSLDGQLLGVWSGPGREKGQLSYPYDVETTPDGDVLACEYGNNRISVFSGGGKFRRVIGSQGNGLGQFHGPWAAAIDRAGRLYVADTYNHRIQRFEAGVF